jgi:hypothetical protein
MHLITNHLIYASRESGSSQGKAFQESFQHAVRTARPTCGSFAAKQTASRSSNVGDSVSCGVGLASCFFDCFGAPFCWGEAAIDESFADIQPTLNPQTFCQCFEHTSHDAGAHPLLESAMTSLIRRVSLRQVGPGCAGTQYPKYTVENTTSVFPRSASPISAARWLGNERVERTPLCVGQVPGVGERHRFWLQSTVLVGFTLESSSNELDFIDPKNRHERSPPVDWAQTAKYALRPRVVRWGCAVGRGPTKPVSALLVRWKSGDQEALQALMPLVYDELRRIAHQHLQAERADHTLRSHVLVHEAYLRLVDQKPPDLEGRAHFFTVAARLMRQILVDYARRHQAAKRGYGCKVTLDQAVALLAETRPRCACSRRCTERTLPLRSPASTNHRVAFFRGAFHR